MSDKPFTDDDRPDDGRSDDILAGELALNLLEGEELLMARGRMAREPEFVEKLAWWHERLAPMSDYVAPVEPSSEVWQRIERAVAGDPEAQSESAQIISLKQRLRNWQIAGSAAAMAAVASVALVVLTPSQIPVTEPASQAPLVASIPIADTPLRLGVTYLPDSSEMLVSASGLSADGVHDHELWLVPADGGDLQSLGVIVAGEELRVRLPDNVTRNMGDGVAMVITREPLGGKPEGEDAGPVVAEGVFKQV